MLKSKEVLSERRILFFALVVIGTILHRLTQFISIEMLILAAIGFDCLYNHEIIRRNNSVLIFLMFLLVFIPFLKMINSIRPSKVYRNGTEVAANIPIIVEKLKRYGSVEEVVSLHYNPLYHFVRGQ